MPTNQPTFYLDSCKPFFLSSLCDWLALFLLVDSQVEVVRRALHRHNRLEPDASHRESHDELGAEVSLCTVNRHSISHRLSTSHTNVPCGNIQASI